MDLNDDDLVHGRYRECAQRLRSSLLIRSLDAKSNPTPKINFDEEDSSTSEVEAFALACWEGGVSDEAIAEDAKTIERFLSFSKTIPFRNAWAWLCLKTRPTCSKDELHDAQTLVELYLKQCAQVKPRTAGTRAKYARLTELLTLRILPRLGLYESAVSFLARENSPGEELLEEQVRVKLETELVKARSREITRAATVIPGTAQPLATTTPNPTANASSLTNGQPFSTGDPLAVQKMVEEFEKMKREREARKEESIKIAAAAAISVLVLGIVWSERKRFFGGAQQLADIVFGDS